jgi:antitoxin component of MazEF toxin-antitoxin module
MSSRAEATERSAFPRASDPHATSANANDRVEYDLDALVAGITARNVHRAVDFGPPVGKEPL